ncbi:MAG: DUF1501 domain-containing protein [Verrucomicrobiales bacterium]|nr:DUF1501 domain-containing protein [Verrucomicrobiales bacterium]
MTTRPPNRLSRRAAIRAGALGTLGGLGMDQLSRLQAATPAAAGKAKNVIYIFLSGGLSQIDSFDMKPDQPSDIRGEFQPIPTKTPGLHICEHLPELAKRSEEWAICRTISHGSNEHSNGHHIMLTGRSPMPTGFDPGKPKESDFPSISALAGHLLPAGKTLPSAMVLPEKIVHRTGRTIPGQFAGQLGRHYDPFFLETSKYNATSYGAYPEYLFHHETGAVETDMGFHPLNLELPASVDYERFQDRLGLQQILENQARHLEKNVAAEGADRYREMAVSLLADPKTKAAFDIKTADKKTRETYGENAFGWSLLLARQLVEAGVNLVQVNLGNNEAWDTHQTAFPNLKNYLFPPMDRAVSALLDDLGERGMLDDTLLVMASEFGRTPKVFTLRGKKHPGRDHWGALQSVWFAGGGIRGGSVLGKSDKVGGHPIEDGRTPEDFAATIYQALGIPSDTMWHDVLGRPMPLYHGEPLNELFG